MHLILDYQQCVNLLKYHLNQGLEKRESYLRQELERLRMDYAAAKDENTTQSKELVDLKNEVEQLKMKLKDSDTQNKSSHAASSQYQMLLDMALEKLRSKTSRFIIHVQNALSKRHNKASARFCSESFKLLTPVLNLLCYYSMKFLGTES